MKTDDKNGTADAKECMVTGAENGSTKVGTRNMSNSHRPRGQTSTTENIGQKKGGGCIEEGDVCSGTWVMIGNLAPCFPYLEKRKGRDFVEVLDATAC